MSGNALPAITPAEFLSFLGRGGYKFYKEMRCKLRILDSLSSIAQISMNTGRASWDPAYGLNKRRLEILRMASEIMASGRITPPSPPASPRP